MGDPDRESTAQAVAVEPITEVGHLEPGDALTVAVQGAGAQLARFDGESGAQRLVHPVDGEDQS